MSGEVIKCKNYLQSISLWFLVLKISESRICDNIVNSANFKKNSRILVWVKKQNGKVVIWWLNFFKLWIRETTYQKKLTRQDNSGANPKSQTSRITLITNNMRKILLLSLAFIAVSFFAQSQVKPRAIGVRLGGGSFVGGELSYQKGLGNTNRLELDFGFGASSNHSRIYAAGIYQWDMEISDGFNWYIGPGASVGLYTYDNAAGFINIAVGGQIGIEYDFTKKDVPLLLSLDTRPMWDFLGSHSGLGWGASLGIRYVW